MSGINYILVHIGNELPNYFFDCLEQLQKYNNKQKVYMIIPNSSMTDSRLQNDNFVKISNDEALNSERIKEFDSVNYLEKQWGHFWSSAIKRFIIIEDLIRKYDLENVVHIENDILVYSDFMEYLPLFKELYHDKVAINPVGDKHVMFACVYINNLDAIVNLNNDIITLLKKGDAELLSMAEGGAKMINEMVLLRILLSKKREYLSTLPMLPEQDNFDKFKSLFDGASWGQYAGGTNGGPWQNKPGFTDANHYVGQYIRDGVYDVKWINSEPFALRKSDDKLIKINNLHIHSKNLNLYR